MGVRPEPPVNRWYHCCPEPVHKLNATAGILPLSPRKTSSCDAIFRVPAATCECAPSIQTGMCLIALMFDHWSDRLEQHVQGPSLRS
jgi:hypothetical protein